MIAGLAGYRAIDLAAGARRSKRPSTSKGCAGPGLDISAAADPRRAHRTPRRAGPGRMSSRHRPRPATRAQDAPGRGPNGAVPLRCRSSVASTTSKRSIGRAPDASAAARRDGPCRRAGSRLPATRRVDPPNRRCATTPARPHHAPDRAPVALVLSITVRSTPMREQWSSARPAVASPHALSRGNAGGVRATPPADRPAEMPCTGRPPWAGADDRDVMRR